MEAVDEFHQYDDQIDLLIREHEKSIQEEPLLLAIQFQPDGGEPGPYLLEVCDNFGSNRVNDEREVMQVSYMPSSQFPLRSGESLTLVLTNPPEFRAAIDEEWSCMEGFMNAIRQNKWRLAYKSEDPRVQKLLDLLR